MGPKTDRLVASLGQALSLLQEQGDGYHENQVAKCKLLLEKSDFRGVTLALSVFNGKNSIHEIGWSTGENDGDRISAQDRFQILSNTIYELADSIRREVERGGH